MTLQQFGNSLPALASPEPSSGEAEMEMHAHCAYSAASAALVAVMRGGESQDALAELEAADASIMHAIRILRARRAPVMEAAE